MKQERKEGSALLQHAHLLMASVAGVVAGVATDSSAFSSGRWWRWWLAFGGYVVIWEFAGYVERRRANA